jgi:hypothetical protein
MMVTKSTLVDVISSYNAFKAYKVSTKTPNLKETHASEGFTHKM